MAKAGNTDARGGVWMGNKLDPNAPMLTPRVTELRRLSAHLADTTAQPPAGPAGAAAPLPALVVVLAAVRD